MRSLFSNLFFFSLIVLLSASCSQKQKKEESVASADSTKQPVVKTDPPKAKDHVVVEKSVEKKENKPTTQPKKNKTRLAVKAEKKGTVKKPTKVFHPIKKTAKKTPPVKKPLKKPTPVKEDVVVVAPPAKEAVKKIDSSSNKKPKGKPYYFKVLRKEDGKEIFGYLQLQEAVGAKQFQLVKSGEIVYLEKPLNRRGTYSVAALLPGYRQRSLIFRYFNPPIAAGTKNEEIVTLTLEKARAGDYIDFNNLHFFKNTSIMRPVSQAELDEVVNLLKENQRYKIKVYGYCNGRQDRESYTMGSSTNFFAMDPKKNRKEKISSKELSIARAQNVKAYFVKQGVDPSRINTKGVGGKVALYAESGAMGQYNDRIEIQFVKN
jgi:outer membrane protein OmpA-like peptidoglycan-associated protein